MENLQKALNQIFGLTFTYYTPKKQKFFPLRLNKGYSSKKYPEKIKIMSTYIFPHLRLKKKQAEITKVIYNL